LESKVKARHDHCIQHDADDHEAKFRAFVAYALPHLLGREFLLHQGVANAEDPIHEDEYKQGDDGYLGWKAIPDRREKHF
jgi:hypothetical protein